jgi:hypothetical protein
MYIPAAAVLLIVGLLLVLLTAGVLHTIGIVLLVVGGVLFLLALFTNLLPGGRTR